MVDAATVSPQDFDDLLTDGPYCVSGSMPSSGLDSSAGVHFNVNQARAEGAAAESLAPDGAGLFVDLFVNGGSEMVRVQLNGLNADWDASYRWCVNLSGSQSTVIPWESFNTECWSVETGQAYGGEPITSVLVFAPGLSTAIDFDFCVNDIGPP